MKSRGLILLLLLGYMMPAVAVEDAGHVLFVAGTVTAERTVTATLKKDDPIYEKDVIVTAERSRGQLLMRDGAKFALRPDTRFVVEEYFLAGDERVQPDGSVVVAAQDSAVTGLIKGGFRTITGAIGKDNADDYVAETPGATMGIRGTHYSVVWCAADCPLPPGIKASPIKDGLYIGVTDGIVAFKNLTGEYTMGAGEFVYIKDRNSVPVWLPEKPAVLIDTYPTDAAETEEAAQAVLETIAALGATSTDDAFGSPGGRPGSPQAGGPGGEPGGRPGSPQAGGPGGEPDDDSTGTSFDSRDSNDGSVDIFEGEPDIPTQDANGNCLSCSVLSRPVAMAIGSISGMNFTSASNIGTRMFSGNDLTVFQAPSSSTNPGTTYTMGTAMLRDNGFDPVTGMGWGRWTEGTPTITQADGTSISFDPTSQSLHWVYAPFTVSAPALPISGTAAFSLIAGNTDPTDTMGNSGVLGNATLTADFATSAVSSTLSLAIGPRGSVSNWDASGSGTISNGLFSGSYSVLISGPSGDGTGTFNGFFGAPASIGGMPNGAGLTYGLTDSTGTTSVSGAVVFGPPR